MSSAPAALHLHRSASRPRISWLIAMFVFGVAGAGERLFLILPTGGRGLLLLGPFLLAGLAVSLIGTSRNLRSVTKRFLLERPIYLAYFGASVLLPLLGVAFHDYPTRSLFSSAGTLASVSALVLGIFSAQYGTGRGQSSIVVGVAVLVASVTAIQYLSRAGAPLPSGISSLVLDWDSHTLSAYGYPPLHRSIGTFSNPNELGLWAAMLLAFGLPLLRGPQRVVVILSALMCLVGSQSRAGLAGSFAIISVFAICRFGRTKRSVVVGSVLGLVGSAMVAFVPIPGLSNALEDNYQARLQSASAVFTSGIDADSNLSARFELWRYHLENLASWPMGTWGPPQMVLHLPLDNDYIVHIMQGGVPLLILFVGLLAISGQKIRSESRLQLRLLSIGIAVVALSQPVMTSSVAYLFWFSAGMSVSGFVRPNRQGMPSRTACSSTEIPGNNGHCGRAAGPNQPCSEKSVDLLADSSRKD